MTDPSQAAAFVDARLAQGASYIKIICDSTRGAAYGMPAETAAALVRAAHMRGVLAVAHATVAEDTATVLEAGADVLMHVPVDDARDLLAQRAKVLVPTLAILHGGFSHAQPPEILNDPSLRPWLDADARDNLAQSWLAIPNRWSYRIAVEENVRAAYTAGVVILAGTDSGMPGTAHGASIHQELALLVESGLTPAAALRAATASPARGVRPDRPRSHRSGAAS